MATGASKNGKVKYVRNKLTTPEAIGFSADICNLINPHKYSVESPDGIMPSSSNGAVFMRYADSGISAGVCHEGDNYRTVCLGFPIEALEDEEDINHIITITLDFFNK